MPSSEQHTYPHMTYRRLFQAVKQGIASRRGMGPIVKAYRKLVTDLRLIRYIKNWRENRALLLRGQLWTHLALRNGIVIDAGADDDLAYLFFDIIAGGVYREGLNPQKRDLIIDIGANIGVASLDIASRFRDMEIHAYEPNPPAFDRLQHNIKANKMEDRIRLFQEAVGPKCGRLRFCTGIHHLAASAYLETGSFPDVKEIEVDMIDLNRCVERTAGRSIALVKIDAEGAEVDILDNAKPAAFEKISRIALEYHRSLVTDADGKCLDILDRAGFECQRIPGDATRGMIYAQRKYEQKELTTETQRHREERKTK